MRSTTLYGSTSYQAGPSVAEVSLKRYRHTGKERDEETGLYYHGARYYAPWLGRWTSCDPAGMPDGTNRYSYSRVNPIVFRDPTGAAADRPVTSEGVLQFDDATITVNQERINFETGTTVEGRVRGGELTFTKGSTVTVNRQQVSFEQGSEVSLAVERVHFGTGSNISVGVEHANFATGSNIRAGVEHANFTTGSSIHVGVEHVDLETGSTITGHPLYPGWLQQLLNPPSGLLSQDELNEISERYKPTKPSPTNPDIGNARGTAWAAGVSFDVTGVSPLGLGGSFGLNLEYLSDYGLGLYFYKPEAGGPVGLGTARGLSAGMSVQLNGATGEGGAWKDRFLNRSLGIGPLSIGDFTSNVTHNPFERTAWEGFSVGFGVGKGLPFGFSKTVN